MLALVDYAKQNQWANSIFRESLKDDFDKFKDLETPYGTFAELVYHIPQSVYFWFKRTGKFHFEIKNIQESGADTVVGCDMGCLMNIQGRLSRKNLNINVMHIAQLIAG